MMSSSVEQGIRDSTYEMTDKVWPRIRAALGGGLEIVNEGLDSAPAQLMDRKAGIDFYYVKRNNVTYGVASRVQWEPPGGDVWRSHTIRYLGPDGSLREYWKLLRAIQEGGIYPKIMIQAYCAPPRRGGRLLRIGIARTVDLVGLMTENLRVWGDGAGGWKGLRTNPDDGVRFGALYWTETQPLFGAEPIEVNDGFRRIWESEDRSNYLSNLLDPSPDVLRL